MTLLIDRRVLLLVTSIIHGLKLTFDAHLGCISFTANYERSKAILCGHKVIVLHLSHVLISWAISIVETLATIIFIELIVQLPYSKVSICLVIQTKIDGVVHLDNVTYVHEDMEKFTNLQLHAAEEYIMVLPLEDTQLLPVVSCSFLASKYVPINITKRLNTSDAVAGPIVMIPFFPIFVPQLWKGNSNGGSIYDIVECISDSFGSAVQDTILIGDLHPSASPLS